MIIIKNDNEWAINVRLCKWTLCKAIQYKSRKNLLQTSRHSIWHQFIIAIHTLIILLVVNTMTIIHRASLPYICIIQTEWKKNTQLNIGMWKIVYIWWNLVHWNVLRAIIISICPASFIRKPIRNYRFIRINVRHTQPCSCLLLLQSCRRTCPIGVYIHPPMRRV